MSLSGMFNIGHDVGGFAGPSPDPELLVRWVQMGSLHPRCVTNSWKADGTVTTPWMHPTVTAFARWALRLRYRLMPYLYTLYNRAAVMNEMILRPTFFEFEKDAETFRDCDEVMLGPSILAAPVVEAGARARALYLPKLGPGPLDRAELSDVEGEGPPAPFGWFDFYSEEWFSGGQVVTVAAPLERVPLLVAEGSMIPLTAEAETFDRLHDEPLRCVRIFPFRGLGKSVGHLYEDDGLSWGFRNGESSTVRFEMETSEEEIRVTVTSEGAYKLPYNEIVFATPLAESRPLKLIDGDGSALKLVVGRFRWHEY
jgi:alpha-glucosidase